MRLIDSEPLIKLCTYCADDVIVTIDRNTMAKMLAHAPEIDAVPVVRCKDCRYGYHWVEARNGNISWIIDCRINNRDVPEYGYCYRGERKDDATD